MGWSKGQSGNPHGRPRLGDSISERMRAAVNKHGIVQKIVAMALDDKHPRQLDAARLLLEHGWGKPVQQVLAASTQRTEVTVKYETVPVEPPTANLTLPASEYKALE